VRQVDAEHTPQERDHRGKRPTRVHSAILAPEVPMRPSFDALHRRLYWLLTAFLGLVSALPLVLSAQTAPLQLVSTAWPPFTNAPRQPRLQRPLSAVRFSKALYV